MELKKHHKWVLGGVSSIVVVYMIVSGILLSGVITKQAINHNQLTNRIDELKADTQSKFNELSENVIGIQNNLRTINLEVSTIGEEFETIKLSAGEDFSTIIEDAVKTVVTVKTDISQGTGFIISPDGYLVTNAHILSGAKEFQISDYEQKSISAQFIGYDPELDIALIKIEGSYEFLTLENSDEVKTGEKVIAIGNPLGLQFSVSEGIVSGVHRTDESKLGTYIQTDAALNPGNSGGPLINRQGKVIGINNFKIGGGESLGFALESNYIKEAVNKITLEKSGKNIL